MITSLSKTRWCLAVRQNPFVHAYSGTNWDPKTLERLIHIKKFQDSFFTQESYVRACRNRFERMFLVVFRNNVFSVFKRTGEFSQTKLVDRVGNPIWVMPDNACGLNVVPFSGSEIQRTRLYVVKRGLLSQEMRFFWLEYILSGLYTSWQKKCDMLPTPTCYMDFACLCWTNRSSKSFLRVRLLNRRWTEHYRLLQQLKTRRVNAMMFRK